MPAGVRPPNFHGVKGKSGRKSAQYEYLKAKVIEKAWEKKDKRMTDQDATQIVLKDMTNKVEHSGVISLGELFNKAQENESE